MKTKMIALAAVATTLVGGGALLATNALAQPAVHPTTVSTAVVTQREKHPEIRKAMRQLNAALATMRNAADDFGGHKKDAMADTNNAVNELKAALKFDKH